MRKLLLTAALMLLAGWVSGCDIDYHEAYCVRSRPAPYFSAPRRRHPPNVYHRAPPVVHHRPSGPGHRHPRH